MLRRALQFHFWKHLYLTAISEGPDLRMAAKAVDSEHKPSPDMTKRSLPHLNSYVAKTLLGQASHSSSSLELPTQSCVL